MPLLPVVFVICGILAASGLSWSLVSGTPWYVTVPSALGIAIGLLFGVFIARMAPTYVAFKAVRLARSVREPKFGSQYDVPGFLLPIGFWRLMVNPSEYALAILLCERERGPWRKVLHMTKGQHLYEMFGWGAEAVCRYAMKQDDPRAVLTEAKALAREYPPSEVARYAGHPAGARRGFELLRSGIPYEFGELLV